jgi:drug/metabolite transporter (DMT)-like permease
MNSAQKKNLSKAGLFLATFIWGISFVIMKSVLSSIPPLYILAFRFCGAALILLPTCIGKLKKLDKSYFLGGALMGAALLLGYVFQTYGLRQTTPGKNAFLTSAYCVIVPFLYWVLNRKRPDRYNITAAFICLVGIGLISLDSDLKIGIGDALTIVCGFFYANHIVMTARYIDGRDPVVLAMLQFAFVGITASLAAIILEPFPSSVSSADVWSMVFLTVVSTAICLLLQVFGQRYTPPSQAAVIMTFESVAGAASSHMIFSESFTLRLIIGFALTLAAVIISETKLEFIRKNRVRD